MSKEGQNQSQATKCRHGVTPPMRDARKRMFQKPHNVDSATMRQLEEDLLVLAQVCTSSSASQTSDSTFLPQVTFHLYESEYTISGQIYESTGISLEEPHDVLGAACGAGAGTKEHGNH